MSSIASLAARRAFTPSTASAFRSQFAKRLASTSAPASNSAAGTISAAIPKVEIPRIVFETSALPTRIAGMSVSEWLLTTRSLAKGVALSGIPISMWVAFGYVGENYLRDSEFVAGWLA